MKLTGWHIDGFGLFNDWLVADLPPGLTVLHGPNESGKSTTMAFIRGALFGYPRTNAKDDGRYPPLNGGRHGGRLFLSEGDGDWTIERHSGPASLRVIRPDGKDGSEADIARLVGNADKDVFRNIFAFSLEELSRLSTLEDDKVRELIFATAASGAARPPTEVVAQLEKVRTGLLRPRSSSTLYELRRELEQIVRDIRDARIEAKGYQPALEEMLDADARVAELKTAMRKEEEDRGRLDLLLQLWPVWTERAAAEAELAGMEVPNIPPGIEATLTGLTQRIVGFEEVLAEKRKEADRQAGWLAELSFDDSLPPVAAEVRALFEGLSGYQAGLDAGSGFEADVRDAAASLDAALEELGPGWDRERLATFDGSIPAMAEVTGWEATTAEAREASKEAARAASEADSQVAKLEAEVERLGGQLAGIGETKTHEAISAREADLEDLRAAGADRSRLVERVSDARETLRARQQAAGAVGRTAVAPASGTRTITLIMGGVLLTGAVVSGVLGQYIGAVLAGLAGALLLAMALRSPATVIPVQGQDGRADTASAEAELKSREEEVARADARIADLSRALGSDGVPTPEQVSRESRALSEARRQRDLAEACEAELAKAKGAKERAVQAMLAAKKVEGSRQASLQKTEMSWAEWRVSHGIHEGVPPGRVAGAMFASVQKGTEARTRLDGAQAKLKVSGEARRAFEARADKVLDATGGSPGVKGAGLAAAIKQLHEALEADDAARTQREQLGKASAGLAKSLAGVEADLKTATQERQALLASVGLEDAAALTGLVADAKRRDELQGKVVELSRQIESRVGLGEEANTLLRELATGAVTDWEADRHDAESEEQRLSKAHDEALQIHGSAEQRARQLETSSDLAELENKAEQLREEIARAARHWQKVTLAKALVEATLTRFEERHQPAVVERASELFGQVTDGAYERLFAGERKIEAFNGKDRIDVADLSTGTAQELYLCMRFAFAEHHAQQADLPMMMDEVLVNFDPERAKGVAKVIAGLAEGHQILMFTCHPATLELMTKSCAGVRVVELARYGKGA